MRRFLPNYYKKRPGRQEAALLLLIQRGCIWKRDHSHLSLTYFQSPSVFVFFPRTTGSGRPPRPETPLRDVCVGARTRTVGGFAGREFRPPSYMRPHPQAAQATPHRMVSLSTNKSAPVFPSRVKLEA